MSAGAPEILVDDHTRKQQASASDPGQSAWVSANAGSGKTFVLSRRVVRLLLEGCDPSRILCLTFTKAAAGEMSNRVFRILGEWAVLPEDQLSEELQEVEGRPPNRQQMQRARTLFARALETPGGLKIQTVHAFCEALLHQFPLEANIPGNFAVMDDGQQRSLIKQARHAVIVQAHSESGTLLSDAFQRALAFGSDAAFEKVMAEIISRRDELAQWLEKVGGAKQATELAKNRFGFTADVTIDGLELLAVSSVPLTDSWLGELIELCEGSEKATDHKLAERARRALEAVSSHEKLAALESLFLTDKREPRAFSRFATAVVKTAMPDLEDILTASARDLTEARDRINLLRQITETEPLLIIAQEIIRHYNSAKRLRGLLDFDDLVTATGNLLHRSSASQWVLYKLDLGIDHILLDEAQDTSPRQWQIIDALVKEFFSGQAVRNVGRTIFAVGDEKQSIYSFQGARPESFSAQRKLFRKAAHGAQKGFEAANLNLSFRSTRDVLGAVDAVFSLAANGDGLTADEEYNTHEAVRRNDAGYVEIWPLIHPDEADEPEFWHKPVDPGAVRHQAVLLASRIASKIDGWLTSGDRIEGTGRSVRPGDILVLVRSRDRFVSALNRELKDRGIPVAGADRLALVDHIAVRDLIALGRVVLTPQDDLNLAALLKSPLIGLDEDALFSLAHDRPSSLFEALKSRSSDLLFKPAYDRLQGWMARADIVPVYEFYAGILGADEGRKSFYGRLGAEAEDVLDAFLAMTLSHEQTGLPGLLAFIENLEADDPEIKREFDQASGEVRVMTVHAAKGLEAPIVFVVDKCSAAFQSQHAPAIFQWGSGHLPKEHGYLWVPSSADHSSVTSPALAKEKRLAEEEYRRLLYVAMTRAEDRLIVCGYAGKPPKNGELKLPNPNWHTMIGDALLPDAEKTFDDAGELLAWRWRADRERSAKPPVDIEPGMTEESSALPGWVGHRLAPETVLPRPLNPSGTQAVIDDSLLREKTAPSVLETVTAGQSLDAGEAARNRGTAVHLLLQLLPDMDDAERWRRAENHLAAALPDSTADQRRRLVASVRATLEAPELLELFDPATSRAEVSVMGQLDLASGPRSVSGTIDRISVRGDTVTLIDFKTTLRPPVEIEAVPPDYITQMALYRELVARIYPAHAIKTALVWTHAAGGPHFMELPSRLLEQALTEIANL